MQKKIGTGLGIINYEIAHNDKIVYVGPWYDFDIDSSGLDDPFFNYCVQ